MTTTMHFVIRCVFISQPLAWFAASVRPQQDEIIDLASGSDELREDYIGAEELAELKGYQRDLAARPVPAPRLETVSYVVVHDNLVPGANADYLSVLGGLGDIGQGFNEADLETHLLRGLAGGAGGWVVDMPAWGFGAVQMWFRSRTATQLLTAARGKCLPQAADISRAFPRTYVVLPVQGTADIEAYLGTYYADFSPCIRTYEVNADHVRAILAREEKEKPDVFKQMIDSTVGPVASSLADLTDRAIDLLAQGVVAGAGLVLQVLDLVEDILKEIMNAIINVFKKIMKPIIDLVRPLVMPFVEPFKDMVRAILGYVKTDDWDGTIPVAPTTEGFKNLVMGAVSFVEPVRRRAERIFAADLTGSQPFDPENPGKVVDFLDSITGGAVSIFLHGAASNTPNDPECAAAMGREGRGCMHWNAADQCGIGRTCCMDSTNAINPTTQCVAGSTCASPLTDASDQHVGGCSRGPCLSYLLSKAKMRNREKDKDTIHIGLRTCDGPTMISFFFADAETGELISLDPIGVTGIKVGLDGGGNAKIGIGVMVPGLKKTFSAIEELSIPLNLIPGTV